MALTNRCPTFTAVVLEIIFYGVITPSWPEPLVATITLWLPVVALYYQTTPSRSTPPVQRLSHYASTAIWPTNDVSPHVLFSLKPYRTYHRFGRPVANYRLTWRPWQIIFSLGAPPQTFYLLRIIPHRPTFHVLTAASFMSFPALIKNLRAWSPGTNYNMDLVQPYRDTALYSNLTRFSDFLCPRCVWALYSQRRYYVFIAALLTSTMPSLLVLPTVIDESTLNCFFSFSRA